MEKIVEDFTTIVKLSVDEAKTICKLDQGEKCCAFLVMSPTGFECIRMSYPANGTILSRLKKGLIKAKGTGGWEGCAWKGEFNQLVKDGGVNVIR